MNVQFWFCHALSRHFNINKLEKKNVFRHFFNFIDRISSPTEKNPAERTSCLTLQTSNHHTHTHAIVTEA